MANILTTRQSQPICENPMQTCFPVTSLKELLLQKRVIDLRSIAQTFSIKNVSRMAKTELAETLAAALPTKQSVLENILLFLPTAAHQLLSQAAHHPYYLTAQAQDAPFYAALERLCLLQSVSCQDGQRCFYMPEEWKALYHTIQSTPAALAEQQLVQSIDQYAMAALSLYGILRLEELLQIFNQYHAQQVSEAVFSATLTNLASMSGAYHCWDGYLVHHTLSSNSFAPAQTVLQQAARHARYLPAKAAFLKYADWAYYEKNLSFVSLEKQLQKNLHSLTNSKYSAEELVHKVYQYIRKNANNQAIVNLLLSSGIRFESHMDAQKAMDDIVDIYNNTRLWVLNGNTPRELSLQQAKSTSAKAENTPPISRNAFCPCGSGKKYKKCCGQ